MQRTAAVLLVAIALVGFAHIQRPSTADGRDVFEAGTVLRYGEVPVRFIQSRPWEGRINWSGYDGIKPSGSGRTAHFGSPT